MSNKVACVTGAGARVGKAIALELAQHGFDIIIHYHRNETGAHDTSQKVDALGRHARCIKADLSQHEECLRFIKTLQQDYQHLDVLVNNASLFSPQPFAEISYDMWQTMLQVNVTAPFTLSKGLLPLLKKGTLSSSGRKASIVHICDIGADRPLKGYTHYAVSKAALQMLVKSMAIELAPEISCIGISPGQVAWPPFFDESVKDKIIRRIPMQRSGTPEDVATLLRYLVLEGSYINGAIIPVDGGLACRY